MLLLFNLFIILSLFYSNEAIIKQIRLFLEVRKPPCRPGAAREEQTWVFTF